MVVVPNGSIYFWMFSQGLKHTDLDSILAACAHAGKYVREKDINNYWNGYYRSAINSKPSILSFSKVSSSRSFYELSYSDYPIHPWLGKPDPVNRFAPCSMSNRPLVKWTSQCMSEEDARAYASLEGSTYIGENLYGTKFIVIDCDGDHEDKLDIETIDFLWNLSDTQCLAKPKGINEYAGYETWNDNPASFHLTFRVDKLIPTCHFPKAHIDILGNQKNCLRFLKNKVSNGKEPKDMDDATWNKLKNYIRKREEA